MSDDVVVPPQTAEEALAAISNEMFDLTGGDSWRSGRPLAQELHAPEATQETPAAQEPQETPAAAEPTSGETKLFLGKFKNESEAERGYHNAVEMGNAAKREADLLRQQLAAMQQSAQPQSRPAETDPLEELDPLIPRDIFERAVERKVDTRVKAALQETFGPAVARMQAEEAMSAKYPEYATNAKDIQTFLNENPDVKAGFDSAEQAGNPYLAREFTYLHWASRRATQQEAEVKEKAAEREKEVKATRKDAGIIKSSQTRVVTQEEPGMTKERLEQLKEDARNGYPVGLWRETIGKSLGPEFDRMIGLGE